MTKSKFAFSVAAPKVKGDVSTEPELTLTCTKDKIRVNTALSRKLNLKDGDRLMFISNEAAVWDAVGAGEIQEEEVAEHVVYAIAKGIPQVDSKGKIVMGAKRLTDDEKEQVKAGTYEGDVDEDGKPIEPAFHGFKLASSSKYEGYSTLEGSDATHWPALGGDENVHKVFKIEESFEQEIGDTVVTAYSVAFDREEPKMERRSSKKKDADAEVDEESESTILD